MLRILTHTLNLPQIKGVRIFGIGLNEFWGDNDTFASIALFFKDVTPNFGANLLFRCINTLGMILVVETRNSASFSFKAINGKGVVSSAAWMENEGELWLRQSG